jgi:hypothetical protein
MEKISPVVLILGGVVVIGLVYVLLQGGQTSSSGFSVVQANPQSVAAVYQANAQDVATQAQVQEAGISSQTSIANGILSYLGTANTNATAATENASNNSTTVQIGQIQAAAANYAEGVAAQAQVAQTQTAAASNQAIAGINANAQMSEATTNANAQTAIAQSAADAQTNISNNQATIAQRNDKTSFWSGLVGSVGNVLGKIFNGPTQTSTTTTSPTGSDASAISDLFSAEANYSLPNSSGSVQSATSSSSSSSPSLGGITSLSPVPYQILSGGNYAA